MSEHNHDCGCGCGDQEEQLTVTLTLDDGSEVECAVLTIFPVNNKNYIALLPITDETEEEGEVFLYRFNELEDDEIELLNIESDEEYEAVADAFDELLDEEEFEEIFEEEE